MKKLLIYIMIFFSILAHAVEVNECKTDIYYGNGVWNEPEDVEKSRKKLEKYIINKEIINGDPKLKAKYGKVKSQYNWGQGYMLDVLETYYQLKEAGQVQNYQFYAVIGILTKGNPTLTIGAIATQELMEPFTRGWEEGNVYDMWEKYYNESFKLSHKVLLVSHSQGGLFANRVHDIIAPTEYQSYFANLQVASPASIVKAQKGDYVTLSTDLTSFDPVVNFIPGSMSANASGDSGHAFVTAYLAQIDPYTKMTIKIKQLLSALDTEPSQWQTDQELNKGTEDYKITVKHRFDSSVIMNEEVYPFAPSKKLYNVTDNTGGNGWVKASCGGSEVLDSWIDKKDNEFYLINNPEEEKIIKEIFDTILVYGEYRIASNCVLMDDILNISSRGCISVDTIQSYVEVSNSYAKPFTCGSENTTKLYDKYNNIYTQIPDNWVLIDENILYTSYWQGQVSWVNNEWIMEYVDGSRYCTGGLFGGTYYQYKRTFYEYDLKVTDLTRTYEIR